MCTAITFKSNDFYFGRNLDLEYCFSETVTITPRNYPLCFQKVAPLSPHYAMVGIAYVPDNYPLYYDATNEKGLSMAGLNFPGMADYKEYCHGKDNITPFEFIPWILGQCASVQEAITLLKRINLLDLNYSKELPLSPLHWIIADSTSSIVVEPVKSGLNMYENPIGVLTNNPSFDIQLFQLNHFMGLSSVPPQNTFAPNFNLNHYSNGMGGIGMPGDWSSQSRFIKASFVKMNSVCGSTEEESISQFFHILGSVEHPRGSVCIDEKLYEITYYSSCCNTDKGIYYYRTYDNSQITAINMFAEDLHSDSLIMYPLSKKQQIYRQNY